MAQEEKESKHEGLLQAVKAFSLLSGAGIYLAVVVGICLFLGNWADEFFDTAPAGRLVGIIAGFPLAFYSLYRQLKAKV